MSSFTKTSNNGGKSKRGNFDSVPADDGFRNYMSRKIELQRKQFGLVVPPPPPSPPPKPSPPTILKKRNLAKSHDDGRGNNDIHTPQFTGTTSPNNGRATPSEKKSVRFHQNVEIEGVSQVLSNLKQRHTSGKNTLRRLSSLRKRRRKSRGLILDINGEALTEDSAPNKSLSVGEEKTEVSNSYTSILGVLDNLQKRHGTSSSKQKRPSSRDNPLLLAQNTSQSHSVLESLESVVQIGSVASPSIEILKNDNGGAGGSTTPSKRKRESPRCKGRSMLEGLDPIVDDSVSQQDDTRTNDCFGEQYSKQQPHQISKSPSVESYKLVLTQLTQPSPTVESHSPAIRESISNTPPIIQRAIQPSPAVEISKQSAWKLNHRPDLFFTGVVILVNGHTSPDATTLMRMLHRHGGDLEKYETRRVTHIIAEQLSAAKANIYKRQKKPTPVCRPDWITDSVERGKLLPFADYLLEDVKDGEVLGTKSVKSFFGTKPKLKNVGSTAIADGKASSKQTHQDHTTVEGERVKPREVSLNECSTNKSSPHRWEDTHPSKANYHLNGQVRTIGNDPNFLESYFSNSRLSYIGSFKQRIKRVDKKTAPHSQSKVGARFVLLVDMDCFFAAVVLRKYPQYRRKPVAVGHSHVAKENSTFAKTQSKNSSSELSTCNYIARKHGIRKGMFLGDAIQLCPELIVLPYDFAGFEEVSGIVADQLHGYAEQYNGCVEQVSCDESYVEINIAPDDCAGIDIYDFVNTLAEHIRADIVKKTECTASIGIGPNKLLAKLAADRIKPNACCVVKDWKEFLEDLDLRDIPGIGRKFQKKLHVQSLRTVNDIWDLEDDATNVLADVIGQGTAQKIVQYCNGIDDRPVTPAVRKSIGAECNYGVRFDGPYGVDYLIQGLAKEVQKRMTGAGVRGSKLVLKVMKSKDPSKAPGKFLGHGRCDSMSRSVDVPLTRDEETISTAAMKMYKNLCVEDKLVRGMGIVINSLKSDEEVTSSNSSPSKLSLWLKKDSKATANISSQEEVSGGDEASKEVTFALSLPEPDCSSIPTFSQLDQDVLHNLPEDILLEVKSMYGKKSSHQAQSTSQSSPKQSKTKHLGKGNRGKPIQIAGQTSVRRMLKLACIKSGDDDLNGKDLSLSQLDCLPLEVQLQIANGDEVEIVKGSKHKTNRSNNSFSFTADQGDSAEVEILSVQSLQVEAQEHSAQEDFSTNFYCENIAPLRNFISSNPNPDSETVETVQEFLSLCIHEKRIDDAVTFLRTIKNMQDSWGNQIYVQLRESTILSAGNMLDIKWLGL